MGCQTEETRGFLSLLTLLPPWDREYPKAMSELGFVLEESKETNCLQAAKALFIELALAYPAREEALRATLEVGALLLYLKEPAEGLEKLLVFPERGARLLEVAKISPPEKAVVFLKTFGGAQAESLLSSYLSWLRDNPDRPQIPD